MRYQNSLHQRRLAERSLKHLTDFLDLSDELVLGKGIEALINRIVQMASKVMKADRASLFLVDPATGDLWSRVAEGEDTKMITIPAGTGIAGWVAQHDSILNIREAYNDERFNPAVDKATGYHTKTILSGPVRDLQGRVIGVIQVINKLKGEFDDQDISLFNAFAHQASVAVENSNLYQRLMTSHQKMAIMLDVANSVSQTLELPNLIHKIIEKTTEILLCDRSSFFVLDRERNELWSMEAKGTELKEIRFPATLGLGGYTATHNEMLNIKDVYQDPRFNRDIDKRTGYRTYSMLSVPVDNRQGEVIGVIQAVNKEGGVFETEDVELLKAISSQIGVALENSQLYADTISIKNYLKSVQESITNCIITLDPSCNVVTANRAAYELFGLQEDNEGAGLLGASLEELLGDKDHSIVQLVREVCKSQNSIVEYDISLQLPNDQSHSINANVLPLTDHEEKFRGVVIVLEDFSLEKRLKSNLTRYLAKDIVEKMLSDPKMQALGGERIKATVLFTDIRQFTPMAEGLSAEATMDFLNEYFTIMVDEVIRQGGLLDKFIGDSLLAVFGVPYNRDDDALRAVYAALNMQEVLNEFNRRRKDKGLGAVRMGIGINTDEVISGNLGSEKKMDYTVIGDGVNISSRLEGLNKNYGTNILLSDSTLKEIGDRFTTRPIDYVRVKGKTASILVHEVLGDSSLGFTESQELFNKGFQAYRNRDFAQAVNIFSKGSRGDRLFATFLERCNYLLEHPPARTGMGFGLCTTKPLLIPRVNMNRVRTKYSSS